MTELPDLSRLTHDEKDALIRALWAQVQALTAQVHALVARVAELEAKLDVPPKTPDNSGVEDDEGERAGPEVLDGLGHGGRGLSRTDDDGALLGRRGEIGGNTQLGGGGANGRIEHGPEQLAWLIEHGTFPLDALEKLRRPVLKNAGPTASHGAGRRLSRWLAAALRTRLR